MPRFVSFHNRLRTTNECPQGVAVPDHDGAAPGLDDPSGTPQGKLFVDRFAAGADHASEIVLRQGDGDVVLLRSAVMLRQDQEPLCKTGWKGEKGGVLDHRA